MSTGEKPRAAMEECTHGEATSILVKVVRGGYILDVGYNSILLDRTQIFTDRDAALRFIGENLK